MCLVYSIAFKYRSIAKSRAHREAGKSLVPPNPLTELGGLLERVAVERAVATQRMETVSNRHDTTHTSWRDDRSSQPPRLDAVTRGVE